MNQTEDDTMRRYEQTRDDLVARLLVLEELLSGEHRASLHEARGRLARGKFVLAVLGEFSSGKSFLLNVLLGKFRYEEGVGGKRLAGLLAVDINPSTATITEIEYGATDEAAAYYEGGRSERIPLDALNRFIAPAGQNLTDADVPARVVVKADSAFLRRGFLVADTPGLASVNPAHRRATLRFLPSADAVLYLIDTQQPFTEGDAAFLGIVRRYVESIFVVQTKIDLWRQVESDGRAAWEHANERIARLTAVHVPQAQLCAVSARQYAEGMLAGDELGKDAIEASGFPHFFSALDTSLVARTGRSRLRRAGQAAAAATHDEITRIDGDLAMLALHASQLHARRLEIEPTLRALEDASHAQSDALLARAAERRINLEQRGLELADELERGLSQSFDTADVARLRDRERLHVTVDRTVAQTAGEFAQYASDAVVSDLESAMASLGSPHELRWKLNEAAAAAFDADPSGSLWSGDARSAIAATIVLEAIGGPAVTVVHEISSRFAQHPAGTYMKRELIADLRATIFPGLRAEIASFAAQIAERVERLYDDLSSAIRQGARAKRDAEFGSIERALQSHARDSVPGDAAALQAKRTAIEQQIAQIDELVQRFIASQRAAETTAAPTGVVRISHAEALFDRGAYDRGLRPQRWRVAVLGALRRGKSAVINAFAGETVLADDLAASMRFPVHVRYGDPRTAFALTAEGAWNEIAFEDAAVAAERAPVLVVLPWTLPRELVLVHAPAFDSGDANAEDINAVVAGHASESLCLFSRQLSDRELDLYERVAELGRPMLFAHTLADNETARERRRVVEVAQEYLKARAIAPERIFVVSALEYTQARRADRAPAGWNEMDALRSTLEGHAEAHMARLERLAKAHATGAAGPVEKPAQRSRPGFLGRFFGKGR